MWLGHHQTLHLLKAVVLTPKSLFGSPGGQNYLHNKAKMLLAFFTLSLSQVHSGVFQMLYDL